MTESFGSFIHTLGVDDELLSTEPANWVNNQRYASFSQKVANLCVTKYLDEEYFLLRRHADGELNLKLTKDEQRHMYLFQVGHSTIDRPKTN